MHPIFYLLAGTVLLAGCAGTSTTKDGGPSAGRYEGHLVMAPEMHVFVPCNAEAPLWLVADEATDHRLEAQYTSLVSEPYEEAFAVLRGTPGPQLDCPGCRDFPGSFRVSEIIEYRLAEAGDCR